jgi:hypothetical protein
VGIVQRQITGESVYRAIEADGIPLIRQQWFTFDDDGKPVGACLLGTAALNLHVAGNEDYSVNDNDSLLNQLNAHNVSEYSPWYDPSNGIRLGNTIINWFDKTDRDQERNSVYLSGIATATHGRDGYPYVLQTHEEIMAMVKDILTPVWNTTFVVDSYEF